MHSEWLLKTMWRGAVTYGSLRLTLPSGKTVHLTETARDGPVVHIRLATDARVLRLALLPYVAIGEEYRAGRLQVVDGTLADFLQIGLKNGDRFAGTRLGRLTGRLHGFVEWLARPHDPAASRQNAKHHYDLSSDLYDRFLDHDRQYSCAYFPTGREDIDEAQFRKKVHIAAKLALEPGQSVLDIGCGWGGLAEMIAGLERVSVTGITLSDEQYAYARARAQRLRGPGSVQIELADYRDLNETFDRIVSVGMLEHVGRKNLETYFRVIAERLSLDGIALIHTIGNRRPATPINPWIRDHIFPGAYVPTLSELTGILERLGLFLTDVEILRLHYAETLRLWNERFQASRDEIADLYDDAFCRMWEFYLQSCEAGFRYGNLTVFQLQIAKRVDAAPLIRDYMVDDERAALKKLMSRTLSAAE